jgi:hypothetical protein
VGFAKGVPEPWAGTVVGDKVALVCALAVADFIGVWVACGVDVAGAGLAADVDVTSGLG